MSQTGAYRERMTGRSGFELLEDTADLGFISCGENLSECFGNAARALSSSLVDPETVDVSVGYNFEIKAKDLEMLLHDFLSEILYIFETEDIIFKVFDVVICEGGEPTLSCRLFGESIDLKRHEIKTEIKAVTYHEISVRKEDNLWKAKVICDL